MPPATQRELIAAERMPFRRSRAELRAHYHEPEKQMRQVSYDRPERTDSDGRFLLRDVGIQVAFVLDVIAPN